MLWMLLACGEEEPAVIDTSPEGEAGRIELAPPEEGFQLHAGPFVVPGYSEAYHCAIVQADAQVGMLIEALEHQGSETLHHFNVWGLSETELSEQAGDCGEMWGQVNMSLAAPLYASQTLSFSGEFPEGVAAKLPSQWYLLEMHAVNASEEALWAEAYLNVYKAERDEVEHLANALYGSNADLDLAPGEQRIASKRCYVDQDMEIVVLASHMHMHGTRFEILALDEDDEPGEVVYSSDDWQTPPLSFYEPTIPVKAGSGFEWRCHYDNQTQDFVSYGPDATDEMCMMVGIYYPDDGFKTCRSSKPGE